MNKFTMLLGVRRPNDLATKHAVETFMMELTSKTDIIAILSNDSFGQFIYYDITTGLSRIETSHIAHDILNDFEDETGAWYQQGNMRKLRRYLIARCNIMEK